jgi:hypothetical protein
MVFGGKDPLWGKHRTEGTEVTEGDGALHGGRRFGGQLGLGVGKTPACIKCLLVPGGRVLNPQSYHSAFRISSTRHEEALADGESPS